MSAGRHIPFMNKGQGIGSLIRLACTVDLGQNRRYHGQPEDHQAQGGQGGEQRELGFTLHSTRLACPAGLGRDRGHDGSL